MARAKDQWTKVERVDGKTVLDESGKPKRIRNERWGKGLRWLGVWIGPDGREKTHAFATKREAQDYAQAQETDLSRGQYLDGKSGMIKLKDYVEDTWLPAQLHLRDNSGETYQSHLKNHITPAFGEWYIAKIDKPGVEKFVISLKGKGLAPSTIETIFSVLRAILEAVTDGKLISANPCRKVKLPEKVARVVEPLPVASVLALAEAITPRYRLLVLVAAMAGLREGEAFGLTAAKVDFLRRRIHVHLQVQKGKLTPQLKSKTSKRTIPADDRLLREITAHMQTWAPGPDGVIVTNRVRKLIGRSSFGTCWQKAVKAAGLPKGTRFHDLRHFHASAQIRAGVNPKALQVRMGHASITETMDTYGHLFPDDMDLGRVPSRRSLWNTSGV